MITTVKNGAQLLKALQSAHNGDTILLAAGTYSNIAFNGFNFTTGVTIASADPNHEAVLSNLTVSNSSGLTLQQLDLTTTTGTAATVSGSKNITFSQDTFSGSSSTLGNAMLLSNSSKITVTGSTFAKFGTGINVVTDSNLTVTNNTFHGIGNGAVRGTGLTSSTISGNTFTDASTTVPTHTDVVYLWGTGNSATISNNFYGPPLPAVLTTATQLMEALQNAHPGDVIKLAAGTYPAVLLNNIQFSSAVTIVSADPAHPAVFTDLNVSNSSGLNFQGVTFSTATGTAASVTSSQNITFTHDAFSGPGDTVGNAMMVRSSSGVTVTGSDFAHFNTGINVVTNDNVTITNNTFEDITGGDLRGTAVTNSTVSGNSFTNASPTVTNHQDVLYLWQDNTANNVTIGNNTYGSSTPVAPPAAPVVLTNAQLLMAALQNAHDGDVIKLAAGTYDGAVLSNLHFANGVTITSADPTHEAVISNLTVSNSSGLVIDGVNLTTGAGTAATVTGSQHIGFTNDTFSGVGTGTALTVSGSSGVAVTGSDIGNFGTGLNLQTDSNVTVTGDNFHGNPSGAIVGAGVTASLISGNTFPGASSTNTAHTDVINLSQDNTANQVEIDNNAYGSAHIVTVSNVQDLQTALASAHAGDVIELAAGTYSSLGAFNLNFATPVTIMSADPNHHAVLQDLNVGGSSGLTFADVTLSTASAGGIAGYVSGSSNILFSHDAFSGPGGGAGNAMMVATSSGVTVANSDFAHFSTGINIVTDSGLNISNSTFENIASGDVRGTEVTNSTISGNGFNNADPTLANHQDVVYLWGQDNTANNVTVSGNTYSSGALAVTDPSPPAGSTSSGNDTTTTPPVSTSPPASTDIVTTGPNVVTVNSTQGLLTALQTAQSGEVIKLAAGSYGDLDVWNLHFSGAGVTITSADTTNEAVVSSVSANGSSGLTFDHLNVQLPANEQMGIDVEGASNVTLSNLTIAGTGAAGAFNGMGVLLRNSTGVTITHSDFGHLDMGLAILDADQTTVSNNTIHDISGDGMDTAGTTNEVVSGNYITNFSPGDGVHPDAIQFFADGDGVANTNMLVMDNVITRGSGSQMQGVFVEHTNNIEIIGNAMAGTMYNGVSLSTTDNAIVTNNFIEGFTDMNSGIMTRGQSANVSVTNNVTTGVAQYQDGGLANPNYVQTGNTVIADGNVGDYSAMNAWLAQHTPSTASLSDSFFLH